MEELTEVITASEFHPTECHLFVYSSSKGTIRLCDMRSQALCDKYVKSEPITEIRLIATINTINRLAKNKIHNLDNNERDISTVEVEI